MLDWAGVGYIGSDTNGLKNGSVCLLCCFQMTFVMKYSCINKQNGSKLLIMWFYLNLKK